MTVFEIYDFLDEKFDFSYTMAGDNVGLLVGNGKDTVKGILVCLDLTDQAISQAVEVGANLIITHHPVIFGGIKSVTADSLIYRVITNGISVISAHTNLDAGDGGINDLLCSLVGLTNVEKVSSLGEGVFFKVGRVGEFEEPISANALAEKLAKTLSVPISYVGENTAIKRLAVCSGGGGGLFREAMSTGADAFLTGDVKHDVFIDSHNEGFAVFDASHFFTEDIIISPLATLLAESFPEIPITENHFCPIKRKSV